MTAGTWEPVGRCGSTVSDHIADSSANLMRFLDAIVSDPPQYRSLVLAAHSEGGLVVRATMIEFVKRWEDGVRDDRTKSVLEAGLRLFAQAFHSRLQTMLMGTTSPLSTTLRHSTYSSRAKARRATSAG